MKKVLAAVAVAMTLPMTVMAWEPTGDVNVIVAYKDGKFTDFDVDEALAMEKQISDYQFNVGKNLSI